MNPPVSVSDIPKVVRDILARRGVVGDAAVQAFLNPDYATGLHSPWLMNGMEAAVARIDAAREHGDKVAIYGDYDIDGITATAVMHEGLAAMGIQAVTYIPDRFEEGYGINQPAQFSDLALPTRNVRLDGGNLDIRLIGGELDALEHGIGGCARARRCAHVSAP